MPEADWEEILGKDVMFQRLEPGVGSIAEMGTTVISNLKGYFLMDDGSPSMEPFETLHKQRFKIGESDIFPGLELALRHASVGELLLVRTTSKFAFGPIGRPAIKQIVPKQIELEKSSCADDYERNDQQSSSSIIPAIPPEQDLLYEVRVLGHIPEGAIDTAFLRSKMTEPDAELMDLPDCDIEMWGEVGLDDDVGSAAPAASTSVPLGASRMRQLSALSELLLRKEAGNRWFTYEDFSRAARAYSKGTRVADTYFNQPQQQASGQGPDDEPLEVAAAESADPETQAVSYRETESFIMQIYLSCLNNLAECQLRLGEPAKAKDLCVRVLELDAANQKALLRAAKACLALDLFEECELCLDRLLGLAPFESAAALAARAERQRLRQAQKRYREQSRRMADNMARSLFKTKAGKGEREQAVPNPAAYLPAARTAATSGSNADCSSMPASTCDDQARLSGDPKDGASGPNAASPHSWKEHPLDPKASSAVPTGRGEAVPSAVPSAVANSNSSVLLLLTTSVVVLLVSAVTVLYMSGWNRPAGSGLRDNEL